MILVRFRTSFSNGKTQTLTTVIKRPLVVHRPPTRHVHLCSHKFDQKNHTTVSLVRSCNNIPVIKTHQLSSVLITTNTTRPLFKRVSPKKIDSFRLSSFLFCCTNKIDHDAILVRFRTSFSNGKTQTLKTVSKRPLVVHRPPTRHVHWCSHKYYISCPVLQQHSCDNVPKALK